MIRTPRLQFVAVEQRHKRALAAGATALEQLLGVKVPPGWPQFPEAFIPSPDGLDNAPSVYDAYFFISTAEHVLVGNGGFHGPPNDAGEVEFGYEIAPEHRDRGYATEAVRGFIAAAFADSRTLSVVAHTLAQKNASNAVLLKAGLAFVAELPNEELGKVWRWQRMKHSA